MSPERGDAQGCDLWRSPWQGFPVGCSDLAHGSVHVEYFYALTMTIKAKRWTKMIFTLLLVAAALPLEMVVYWDPPPPRDPPDPASLSLDCSTACFS